MTERKIIKILGKIDVESLTATFGQIQTDEVIITSERLQHIKSHHMEDYGLFQEYGSICVMCPDIILRDLKNRGTIFMIKKLSDTNLNVIVRIALGTDKKGLKNSVMTFYRVRDKNLKKMIDKNTLLYIRE